MTESTAVP